MHFSKAKSAGAGLAVVLAGTGAGLALRLVQMLCFFDYDTGFYTDGGVTAWLSLLLPVAAVVVAALAFYRDLGRAGEAAAAKSPVAGALAGISGVLLLVQMVRMLSDFQAYQKSGLSAYDSVQQRFIHIAYVVMCGVFGLVQLAMAAGLFTGRNLFEQAPLLYMAAVLWGAANMVMVYVFYAKLSSVVENAFSMVGAAALLLALLYLCKLLARSEPAGAAKRFLVTGSLAIGLTVPYTLANVVLALTGQTYAGEMPVDCQLCSLSVALFVAAVIASCCRAAKAGQDEA